MRMFASLITSLFVAMTASVGAAAAKTASNHNVSTPENIPLPKPYKITSTDDALMTSEQFKDLEKAALKRAARNVASSETVLTDDLLSAPFKSFRDRFLSIKKTNGAGPDLPEQLDALLTEAQDDAKFEAAPNDLKLFIALIAPLKAYKSFVYRVRPYTKMSAATHSMLLSMVRSVMSNTRIFLPTDQWEAVSRYITEPLPGMGAPITNSNEFQAFLAYDLTEALAKSSKRLRSFTLKDPVVWDNQLLYGTASFRDGLDRYRLIGAAEQNALISVVQTGLSQLMVLTSYSIVDLPNVFNQVGYLFAVDTVRSQLPGGDVNGAPSRDRVRALKAFPNYGKSIDPSGARMKAAGNYFKNSVSYALLAWAELQGKPASQVAGLDPAVFNAVARQVGVGAANLKAMMNGETTIYSQVTGETVTIDLMQMFENPPKDLKALLPTAFDSGPADLEKTIDGKSVRYRNYLEGRATAWDTSAWGKYLPGVNQKTMPTSLRVISQAWGGTGVGAFMWNIAL